MKKFARYIVLIGALFVSSFLLFLDANAQISGSEPLIGNQEMAVQKAAKTINAKGDVFKKNILKQLSGIKGSIKPEKMAIFDRLVYLIQLTDINKISDNNVSNSAIKKQWIVYVNSDDNRLYKKKMDDTGTGIAITNAPVEYPVYSPDGKWIIYGHLNDYGNLYKKRADDATDGIAITKSKIGVHGGIYSPDGKWIVYVMGNNDIPWRLYKKSANDDSEGVPITSTSSSVDQLTYSPDGKWLVYQNPWDDWKLYKKKVDDTSDGTAITNVWSENPSYSPDGKSIVYVNHHDGKIYKKSSGDSENGVPIIDWKQDGILLNKPVYTVDGKSIVYIYGGILFYKKKIDESGNGDLLLNMGEEIIMDYFR